jgi:hypothetical protein
MKKYTITENLTGDKIIIAENEDGSVSSFGTDPANSDYQAYLKSLDEAATL